MMMNRKLSGYLTYLMAKLLSLNALNGIFVFVALLSITSSLFAQQHQPLFITMGGWVYRHDKPNQPAFAPFPGFTGPIAVAVSADGTKLYSARNAERLVVQWHSILENGNIETSGFGKYKEFGANPNYRGFYTLTANASGVYVSDAPGWGEGNSFRLDSETLDIVEEFRGGARSGVSIAGIVNLVPHKGPVTYGKGDKWIFLSFEDDSIPYPDRAWIAKEFTAQTERWGIPLHVSTGRPPQSLKLNPGQYGTIRIVAASQWAHSPGGYVRQLGLWQKKGGTLTNDKVAWEVGYNQSARKEWALFRALHEGIGHALGGLPDLHGGMNGSHGPPGNLMSMPAYDDWRRCLDLTDAQLQEIRKGFNNWMKL